MKNIILISLITLNIIPAFAVVAPDASIIQVHDMQMINEQRFRMEEINDFNDVEQEKERHQKKYEQSKTLIERIFNKDSKFVEDEGKIKIQYEE